jgi:hypothetical protein
MRIRAPLAWKVPPSPEFFIGVGPNRSTFFVPDSRLLCHKKAMFGWYRLVLVLVVVFNTFKLTHKKLTPWMFGWRC